MLNQSFSAKNFRSVFDNELRRGNNIIPRFFPEINDLRKEIKQLRAEKKELFKRRALIEEARFEHQLQEIRNNIKQAIDEKELYTIQYMENIELQASNRSTKILFEKQNTNNKPVYLLNDEDYVSFFILKWLQRNIYRIYKVRQSSRDHILENLINFLNTKNSWYVIKTDIKDCYESINSLELINKLEKDKLLIKSNIDAISSLLHRYYQFSEAEHTKIGIPRGIGISAYLAELSLRPIDNYLMQLDNVAFYARYVDDIILITRCNNAKEATILLENLNSFVASLKLQLNSNDKTDIIYTASKKDWEFDYLGYKFTNKKYIGSRKSSLVNIKLSDKRMQKYKKRLETSFSIFDRNSTDNYYKAFRMLVKRINFLTSNTNLMKTKSHLLVGIYYSNKYLTTNQDLTELDRYLVSEWKKRKLSLLYLKKMKISFRYGFYFRKYKKYDDTNSIVHITEAWK